MFLEIPLYVCRSLVTTLPLQILKESAALREENNLAQRNEHSQPLLGQHNRIIEKYSVS